MPNEKKVNILYRKYASKEKELKHFSTYVSYEKT